MELLSSREGPTLPSLLTLAVLKEMPMACFSSANRSLRSVCWGLLAFPVCVAERECGELLLQEWSFWRPV